MKKSILTLILAMMPILAQATPSTLIWIPSTDIQPAGLTHLTSDVYAPSKGEMLKVLGLTWGSGRMEYGLDYLSIGGMEDPMRWNAKMLLKDESTGSPRLAAGAFDIGGDAASSIVYLLGSKTLPAAKLTFGYCVGKESVLGHDWYNSSALEDTLTVQVDANF